LAWIAKPEICVVYTIDWVNKNIDPILLSEATTRERNRMQIESDTKKTKNLPNHLKEALKRKKRSEGLRFIVIPPGDSRDDNPPVHLRHNRGLNYYYQGNMDNCLMGCLVNAVFWMLGPLEADNLLKQHVSTGLQDWRLFVQNVQQTLPRYTLKKHQCVNILLTDDSCPLVVQLRSHDKSESHAISIYRDCIYDAASRFVLYKCNDTINWCGGPYGFECHLKVFRLIPVREEQIVNGGIQHTKRGTKHVRQKKK